VLCALPGLVLADDSAVILEDVVVTAPRMAEPLTVVTDPKAPRQPVPAHDGADYLKTVPGFSVIRKGGSDGDPVFRGMAGSRLNITIDGEQLLGGCSERMDPPTAYISPESYDRITILKGPQTVLHGPGNSAGTVLFEHTQKRSEQTAWKAYASAMTGSFGRYDLVADIKAATPDVYLQGTGTRSHSGNYEDGEGREVHSRYTRWSETLKAGLTPDKDTRIELGLTRSDGEAAYADRGVDGSKFTRENVGLKFSKEKISPLVEKIEVQWYYNYIDHVMDNYKLRKFTPSAASPEPAAMNPDRTTQGGKAIVRLNLNDATGIALGADLQTNVHTNRASGLQWTRPFQDRAREEDASFRNYGLFGELTYDASNEDRWIGGLRADRWHAEDVLSNNQRDRTLVSGFGRYERILESLSSTVYAGLGHAERFPDYWELFNKESASSVSAFRTSPERTTQFDVGAIYTGHRLSLSASGFYSRVNDYILIQSGFLKTTGFGPYTTTIARNVDATTWGGELGAAYALTERWKIDGSLAYVRGENDTDHRPLAQMTPLEGRLGLNYDDKIWSFGSLLRLVDSQNRVAVNQGNIVGQDLGKSSGFAIFSLNVGWRPQPGMLVAAGVDNLFDKTYAEFISKGGAMLPGFTQTTRVNEPGRMLWLKAGINF